MTNQIDMITQYYNTKAFLFDLNGTMIDDMEYHIEAWSDMLNNDLSANLSRAEVRSHMYGTNPELLERIFGPGKFTQEAAQAISIEKERRYQKAYKPHLSLINGLAEFLERSQSNDIKMAIGSAATLFNIDFAIDNLGVRNYFPVIVSGEEVLRSKPAPETYLKAANLLNVAPRHCIVFEDAPKGVEAALRAGMKCVVITTLHAKAEFKSFPNILYFIRDYHDYRLNALFPQEINHSLAHK